MEIWFTMDLTQSHLRTSFQFFFIVFPFLLIELSFAHPVPWAAQFLFIHIFISYKLVINLTDLTRNWSFPEN
jgi:hypothetical protein